MSMKRLFFVALSSAALMILIDEGGRRRGPRM
jgi:hypothetical protein